MMFIRMLQEESQRTQAATLASPDLSDLPSGKLLIPISEKLWLQLLDTLTHCIYAQDMLQRLACVDIKRSSVNNHFTELQRQWTKDYGTKIMYKSTYDQLNSIVSGEKPTWLKHCHKSLAVKDDHQHNS